MVRVRYLDRNTDHNRWWDTLKGDHIENIRSIDDRQLTSMLLDAADKSFIDMLEQGVKYFFIIHTGTSEPFFDDPDRSSNMAKWKEGWNKYQSYWNHIFVVFVSGGTPRVEEKDINMPGERHYIYPVELTADNKSSVIEDFNKAIARLENGEEIIFEKGILPDYAIAMRIMFLASMRNSEIASRCKESAPDFWNQTNAERPEINNLPTDWKTFIEMPGDTKQSVDESLHEWISAHMPKSSIVVSPK